VKSFREFCDEDGVDYFIVEIPSHLLPELVTLNEGHWRASGTKDYMYRVDPENPSIKQLRHVHIAKSKYINSKTMQASWNSDGSKHDKKTFNKNVGSLSAVQSIARNVLELDSKIRLEEAKKEQSFLLLCESELQKINGVEPGLFRAVQA